jgi:hypothetical protein
LGKLSKPFGEVPPTTSTVLSVIRMPNPQLSRSTRRVYVYTHNVAARLESPFVRKVEMSLWVAGQLELRHSTCPLALGQAPDRTGWIGLQGKGG